MKKVLFSFIAVIITVNLSAQPKKAQIEKSFINKNAEYYLFNSQEAQDTFHVYIKTPESYDTTKTDYPVLYVLDGDIVFPIASGMMQYLLYGEYVPEMIIVGIGYGTLDESPEGQNRRSRDYSPTQRKGRPNTGKAKQFLSFLTNELIPFVDKNFKSDKINRTLHGHSMGGLFTTYALLNSKNIFNRYIISSPYLWWDDKSIFAFEKEFAKTNTELNASVFFSYGEDEPKDVYADTIEEMISKIKNKNYSGLKLIKRVFEKGEHFTVPAEALTYGLISVFSK